MHRYPVLLVDASVNLLLGVLLLAFRPGLVEVLGVPQAEEAFYPNLLGGVLFGIGLALLLECAGRPRGLVGLGLAGAVTINLCGGAVLAIWLLTGKLTIPLRGQVILWGLVFVLIGISAAELSVRGRQRAGR
jgi:hypothetical protein